MYGPCRSPIVADHPLRPATRRRLGRPLPHQQADRTQAHLKAPCGFKLSFTWEITPAFAGLCPTLRQIPMYYSPVHRLTLASPPWFACLRHAASIHPEPGSNSQKKLSKLHWNWQKLYFVFTRSNFAKQNLFGLTHHSFGIKKPAFWLVWFLPKSSI